MRWFDAARLLGLPCSGLALPCRTDCPACGGCRMTVYQDTTGNGRWHHCPDCSWAGDTVQVAALVWGVGLAEAAARLQEAGVMGEAAVTGDDVDNYVAKHVERRAEAEAFWAGCRDGLERCRVGEAAALRARLVLTWAHGRERWREGPGNLVGCAVKADVEEFLRPYATAHARGGAGGSGRIFHGRGWRAILVAPYHTAPGRISAFAFAGRDGGPADRAGAVLPVTKDPRPDPGLAGLWAVRESASFDGHAFALSDPFLAARIQVRHFATASRPLPLVSWYDDRTRQTSHSWAAVGRRKVVFWGWEPTPSMAVQAFRTDGLVSLVPFDGPPDREALSHYFRLGTPSQLLAKAVRRARPWKDALRDWAAAAPPDAADALVDGVARYGVDAREFAEAVGLAGRAATPFPVRTCKIGGVRIEERTDGWYYVRGGGRREVFSEAVVRIDRVVGGDGPPRYEGRVLFAGDEIPFECPVETLETGKGRGFVIGLCAAAGLGRPAMTGVTAVCLAEVATQFHTPRAVKICT